jgi:hypothetical protein
MANRGGNFSRLLKKSPGGHSEGAIKRSFLLATEESAFVFNTANQQQILRRAQDDHALSFFSNLLGRFHNEYTQTYKFILNPGNGAAEQQGKALDWDAETS